MFFTGDDSLERSLSWRMGALMLVVLLVLLGIAAWLGRETAIQFALSRLHHDAEAIISGMDMRARKVVRSLPPIYTQPLSGHYYVVRFDDGQRLLSRSLWDHELVLPAQTSANPGYWLTDGPAQQRLLVWQSHYEKGGERFVIAIAEDVAPLLAAIWRFVWIGVIAALAAVLVMLLLQRLAIRRAFARLDLLRDDVRAVREGRRQSLGDEVPVEVRPLVGEFNQLLDAWRQHQERARNAVGNLAHALKGPLNIIYRLGNRQPELLAQAEQMERLIETELKRARITGRAAVGRHFSPRADVADLVETIRALHHRKALEIDWRVDAPATVPLDQNDMLELIGNLLDNAAKWAQRRIRLTVTANADGGFELMLDDDGPGIGAEQRERLLVRGNRLDENQPGHGLGLAIAHEIAISYGGRLVLGKADGLGGLRVRVQLPLTA